ncbi:CIC11C00000005644 [Sungouiella intermedia]|uniref:Autophagy-related protein 17 n=1 Tax=Sungouiella intermedia TaxID=45354 RepID=A0A1L0BR01_9ASCO|nr:CIC11C00000005644 [[Candida] intermedia]
MSLVDEVRQWTDEAFRTLEKAKLLSSLAQAVLESTDHILRDQLPKRLDQAESLMSKVKNYQANVTALMEHLRSKVVNGIIGPHTTAINELLVPALSDLDTALDHLKATSVPLYLINDTNTSALFKLSDFVSYDVIEKLKGNIAVYRSNCDKGRQLLEAQLDKLVDIAQKNNSRYSRCSRVYESQVVAVQLVMRYAQSTSLPQGNSNIVRNILKENASLEQELVSLLEMLTNHYDQCVLAVTILKGSSGNEVDFNVLRNDAQELPSVLKEFGSIHDIIMTNESRAAKFVDQRLPHIESVINNCEELISSYARFKNEDIVRFVLLVLGCEEIFRSNSIEAKSDSGKHTAELYADVVNQLTYHYTQFYDIYHQKYLTELHYEQFVYPRRFLKHLNDFLNGSLLRLEEEESERRRHWLQKYGNFIPKDFVLPGEYNQPSVVQVISEGLDDIQSDTAAIDETRLLDLIRLLREAQS